MIPQKAIGLILGKQGRNIKSLQQIDGISFVELDTPSATLTFGGTEEAVAAVASQVEKQINQSEVPNSVECSLTLVDLSMAANDAMLVFLPAGKLQLPVDLGGGAPGREYFALCLDRAASLDERMAALALSHGADRHAGDSPAGAPGRVLFGLDCGGYSAEFKAMLGRIGSLPRTARIRAEARFGLVLFAFPPAGLAMGRPVPREALARLDLHTGLQPRFFANMKAALIESITKFLLDCGFQEVPPEQRKVVHLIDTESKNRLSITVAELEDGTDARMVDVGRRELDRIAASRSYYQVLGLDAECSDTDVKKAYYRLAKLVHPDKNAHPGAESAMKLVLKCKEALANTARRYQYDRNPVAPPPIQKGPSKTRLKVVKCHGAACKHFVMDIVKAGGELGARVVVRSHSDHRHDSELMRYLNEAWARQEDGMLSAGSGSRFRIDAVRYKTTYRFTDGDMKVILDNVKHKDIGGEAHDHWEVEIRSHTLKEALKTVPTGMGAQAADLACLFHDYVSKVNALGTAMTSHATCMLMDGSPSCNSCDGKDTDGAVELR